LGARVFEVLTVPATATDKIVTVAASICDAPCSEIETVHIGNLPHSVNNAELNTCNTTISVARPIKHKLDVQTVNVSG
jgi:hypothetical protein